MSAQALIALITAAASLIVSVAAAAVTYVLKRRSDIDLATLQDKLIEERSERTARRDYVYEAQKHLYVEFQPVLFQMVERCNSSVDRIKGMAESSRNGRISRSSRLGAGWENDAYHMISTTWDLLAPLALFRLGQLKLTGLDMSVDAPTGWQYLLARELYLSWNMGYELAAEEPALPFDDQERTTRQHVLSAHLEQLVDCLIRHDEHDEPSCLRFGEFQSAFFNNQELTEALPHITLPLTNFRPEGKPVLWRILLTQVHLHIAIIRTFASVVDGLPQRIHPVGVLTEVEWADFDWRSDDSISYEEAVVIPFRAVRNFLAKRFETNSAGWYPRT